ncbi:tetratricopeptide repeat protein [Steroidobacter cummioxidans]|uniref:tetratricopeptide repeat protein n=1 Tax=Steroidobacter cummioxidans TaxID=1803913 RepID=UPI001379B290|nr:tetratricopeptide repeat protein [Steroidobacter cummioxidans]
MFILIADDSTSLPEPPKGALQIDLRDQPEQAGAILDALGLALLHRGRLEDGKKLIERGLDLRRHFFGEDHPDTARSLNSYACALRQSGDAVAAEAEVRKSLAIDSRVFGGSSYPVALNLNELAVTQLQLGEFAAAEQSAQSGLNILETLHLECTDPNVTRLLDALGRVQQTRGNYERAADIYTKVLDLDRRQVGHRHLKYALHLINFATVKASAGKLQEAKEDMTTAVRIIREDVQRPRHPDLVDVLANLGSVLRAMGDLKGAKEVLQEALALNIEVRDRKHPYVGNDHARIGRVSYDLKDFGAAAESFRAALAIYEHNVKAGHLPAKHAFIAEAEAWLARSLVEIKEGAEEAHRLARAALPTWAAEFGERSVEYAITSAVLGRALYLIDHSSVEARERLAKAYPVVVAARGAESAVAKLILSWLEAANVSPPCTNGH